MKVVSKGVLPPSEVYFHTCSALAREIFFYPVCTGHFYCAAGYEVDRGRYDSFLLIHVAVGKGYVWDGPRKLAARAGEFLLVDCYQPQHYGTDDGWEIYWLHFDGALARRYYELCARNGPLARPGDGALCARQLRRIFEAFPAAGGVGEAELSRRIVNALTALMQPQERAGRPGRGADVVDETLCYIAENIHRALPLADLARNAAVSPYHFARLFKRETGLSPHEYILRARLDRAKYLLRFTSMPLKEVARCCGFGSACNFSTAFKKGCGVTPRAFREGEA